MRKAGIHCVGWIPAFAGMTRMAKHLIGFVQELTPIRHPDGDGGLTCKDIETVSVPLR